MASRTIIKSSDGANPRSIVLILVGATLVVFGGVLLLSVGLTVVEILDDPSNVKIVALVLQEMQGEGNALAGDLDGASTSAQRF